MLYASGGGSVTISVALLVTANSMTVLRRAITIAVVVVFCTTFLLAYNSNWHKTTWRDLSQNFGMGDYYAHNIERPMTPKINFRPGTPKPPGSGYSKTLVVPRVQEEDVAWMDEALPADIKRAIYVADDPTAPLHPPKNKGHEVMIYLTYLIDHYDELPDIVIFMHAHQYSWHNADILGGDAAQMITRLSPERVTREGYMNMRCHWGPGCPDWMHPGETTENEFKTEEILIAKAWAEIFPSDPVPEILAQPCCSQFALSKERIQTMPRQTYVFYRDWLLHTPLKDFVSGRVWEYMWQYVFTGDSFHCPIEHICYCDGYGLCFGGEENYGRWFELRNERDDNNSKWLEWEEKGKRIQQAVDEGKVEEAAEMEKPEPGKDREYSADIDRIQKEMDQLVADANERGKDPRNRALESGRVWNEGDGF